jgi:two-component system response regulator MtrA
VTRAAVDPAAGPAVAAVLPSQTVDERVLVIEDDPSLREVIALVLGATGMAVETEPDGQRGLDRALAGSFDLVVLDLMLPRVDGFEVCRRLRERSSVPLVIVTARTATGDLVRGLELGADDYVTKPFESPELVARVRAVLRRAQPAGQGTEGVVEVRDVAVDVTAHRAWRGGQELGLSATEFKLLVELVRHRGQVLTRQVLLERVWGYDYLGDSRLVDMAVKRLRDKLGDDPREPELLTTVRGVGYRMERE